MGSRIIILCFLLGCFSCNQNTADCPDTKAEKHNLILDTAGHWLENLSSSPTKYAYSNNGKSESYDTYYNQWLRDIGSSNCLIIKSEQRVVNYNSSLYKRSFHFVIRRENEADYLKISLREDEYIEMNLQQSGNCIVAYEEFNTGNNHLTTMPVEKMDSIIVKTKTYYNIFKIDLKESLYSFDRKSKVFYFNSRDGLIQFETFDGEVWSLL